MTEHTVEEQLASSIKELTAIEAKWGQDHPELVNTLSRIGSLYWDAGQFAKAVTYGEKVLNIIENQLGPNDFQVVTSAENLIAGLVKIRQFAKAMKIRNQIFKQLDKSHPRFAYFQALKAYIAKESTKSGFRPPSRRKKKKG
ncbi:MAG: tetratricopeptide repeat protein [Desulfobacter sp.]|nr:tetratricopeptide repeat protein [Desulfobacter sp.]